MLLCVYIRVLLSFRLKLFNLTWKCVWFTYWSIICWYDRHQVYWLGTWTNDITLKRKMGSSYKIIVDIIDSPWQLQLMCVWKLIILISCNVFKRLLHDIFHIDPGISPRLPYQARQRRWRADMGRGLMPGTIWKISCHNLFITHFTLTFSKHWRGSGWLNALGSWIT
jgi:hypothetical protein